MWCCPINFRQRGCVLSRAPGTGDGDSHFRTPGTDLPADLLPGGPANPRPIAYLVLQADSRQTYKFVMSVLSTLVTAYFLLVLILTVAITWCINRLIVRPLRKLARELNDVAPQDRLRHQLTLPRLHHDDEIGLLVRSYNRNQQTLLRQHDELTLQSTRFPVSELPNKAFFDGPAGADRLPAAKLGFAGYRLRNIAGHRGGY